MTKTSSELLSTFINTEAKPKQHCVKNTVYLGKIWQDGASYCGLLVVKLVVKRGWLTTKDFKYTYQTLRILVDRTAGIYQKKKVVRTTFFLQSFYYFVSINNSFGLFLKFLDEDISKDIIRTIDINKITYIINFGDILISKLVSVLLKPSTSAPPPSWLDSPCLAICFAIVPVTLLNMLFPIILAV